MQTELNGHTLAYDASRERVVIYGGNDVSAGVQPMWEWTGEQWQVVAAATDPTFAPSGSDHALVFDVFANRLNLFSGSANTTRIIASSWDKDRWTEGAAAVIPDTTSRTAMISRVI